MKCTNCWSISNLVTLTRNNPFTGESFDSYFCVTCADIYTKAIKRLAKKG